MYDYSVSIILLSYLFLDTVIPYPHGVCVGKSHMAKFVWVGARAIFELVSGVSEWSRSGRVFGVFPNL